MNRLEELLAKWDAGALSPAELAELKQRLGTSQGRAELVGHWLLDETIHDTLCSYPAGAPAVAQARVAAPPPAVGQGRARGRRRFRWLAWHEVRFKAGWFSASAAAAGLVLAGFYVYYQRAPVGTLVDLRAGVTVERAVARRPAVSGRLLYPGDTVRVPAGGAAAVVCYGEATRLDLEPGAQLRFSNPLFGKRFSLDAGALDASVAAQPRWRPMIITTPQARVEVVGTQFALSATASSTRLEVLEGIVRLRKNFLAAVGGEREVLVHTGEAATAAPGVKLEARQITGSLAQDAWAVPPGIALTDAPARGTRLSAAELSAAPANTVERLRGYLVPPVSGDYSFWIATPNDETSAELWLSPDADPSGLRRVAYLGPPETSTQARLASRRGGAPGRHGARSALEADARRFPSQESLPQKLVLGRRYFIEVWYAGIGPERIAICWRLPGDPAAPPRLVDIQALRPAGGLDDEPGTK